MAKIKYDINLMKYISVFGNITRTDVKDCIEDENGLIFIVQENQIGKAIGKKGVNVKMLERTLNRKIKIVEFNPELTLFVKNLVHPIEIRDVGFEDNVVTITGTTLSSRSMLIGRDARNLRKTENIVKRYFDIEKIKVV